MLLTEQKPKRQYNKKPPKEIFEYSKISDGMYAINPKIEKNHYRYDKERILKIIERNDENEMRKASNYFYRVSGVYRNLINYYTNLLTYDYLIVPRSKSSKTDFRSSKFDSDHREVLNYTDNEYIQSTNRYITFSILLEAVFYGYLRVNDNSTYLQQLPVDYCRSNYTINGNHAIEFNLRFFEQYKDQSLNLGLFKLYPEEFKHYYQIYKSGFSSNWVQLDHRYARCHKFNSDPLFLFSTIFPELINLQEYKEMDKAQSKLDLYKLLVQTIPLDSKTNKPTMELPENQALHKLAKQMITNDNIDVLTTPLKVDVANLQDSKSSIMKNNLDRVSNSVFLEAGTSKTLFNSDSDGGSIGLSISTKVDESMLFGLLEQYKRWHDSKLSELVDNRNYTFEIIYPPITIFNRKDMYDMYKDSATSGYSKLLSITALGMRQSTFLNLLKYEKDYCLLEDIMIPLKSSHTSSDKGGRPEKDEKDLTSKGETTKNKDVNKEYS